MRIDEFLGINENPDGDTGLKPGEAAVMVNWRVTADGHLRLRPGTRTLLSLGATQVRGIFRGRVGQNKVCVAACGGHLWSINEETWEKTDIGTLTDDKTAFFGFSGKLYILNGHEYMCWGGDNQTPAAEVSGYVPIIAVAAPPAGGGTLLETANRLTGKKRMRFSPDGTTKSFQLPETDVASIDSIISLSGVTLSAYSVNVSAGTVTFTAAPPAGTSSLEIAWTKGAGDREKIERMHFAETFNGAATTRVFLSGDGTNEAVYSGIGEDLLPNAEYFPELNVLSVDSANTPVTALIKHYDRLLCFKPDGCYAAVYGTVELKGGAAAAAFYVLPVHRSLGNEAPGEVRLVDNCPVTLCRGALLKWVSGASGAENERNAKRVSARIEATLSAMQAQSCITCDDQLRGEYYVFSGDKAAVMNYLRDCFYVYEGISVTAASAGESLMLGTAGGALLLAERELRSDSGGAISALWESGSLDFGAREERKSVSDIWLSMKPGAGSRCLVSVLTERGQAGIARTAAMSYISFAHIDFAHFSFGTSRRAQVQRLRIRAKKCKYWKLRLESNSASAGPAVLGLTVKPFAVSRAR